MKLENFFAAENTVELRLYDKNHKKRYLTRIIELDKNTIHIAVPISNGKYLTVDEGDKIFLFNTSRNATYLLVSEALKIKNRGNRKIIINRPKTIKKIQRREYMRIPANIKVSLNFINENLDEKINLYNDIFEYIDYLSVYKIKPGHITNISGGGAAIITPEKCPTKWFITLIRLPHSESFYVLGNVLKENKIDIKNKQYNEIKVVFKYIDENDRDKIIRYGFDKELREKRNRESE